MGKPFREEISRLQETASWAFEQKNEAPLSQLRLLINRWTDGPVVVVGSGGSYSAAVAWASFHRKATGEACYATTPLGLEELITSLRRCRVLLLTAEGKNHDILNAAKIAQAFDVPCAALTLTTDNPLIDFSDRERTLFVFGFQMNWGKDGYLATNTLFAMVVIAARVYFQSVELPTITKLVSLEKICERRDQLLSFNELRKAYHQGLLVLHGASGSLLAVDLESKMAEAALSRCEIADFRQFSHGRHLQLSQDPSRLPVVLIAFSPEEEELAIAMLRLFPIEVPYVSVQLQQLPSPFRELQSLCEAFLITEAIGEHSNIDPGQPQVPEFGREIYRLDSSNYKANPTVPGLLEIAVERKIGGAEVSLEKKMAMKVLAKQYADKLSSTAYRSIIFDFDGTLCHAHERFLGISPKIRNQLCNVLDAGLTIGIATGRGRGVLKGLKTAFPQRFHNQILIGLYSGSLIGWLSDDFPEADCSPELEAALAWLQNSVLEKYALDAQGDCKAGQLSIRLGSHHVATRVKHALDGWIVENRMIGWRVFSSGHSVDLLDASSGKNQVVDRIVQDLGIEGESQILLIGDAGHAGGNDFELLRHRYSLSADQVSDSLYCCWNFSPPGVRQADATQFYLSAMKIENGYGTLNILREKS
ncbi:hypothetical protein [Herbaspirillum seropedicae]|uniref:hypothetical protein n=1 Tax=Herbaspirillum seropedicae TaxID=964 RepID=UPI000863BDAE|nr:hypothetical protein [Herbaspirillum seropedicae]AON52327.1 HAD-superfamily protein [Herbaspirillum seropedicae]